MAPGVLLLALLGLTAVAVALDVAAHRRRTRALRVLASQWRMNYHPADQLRVTPKVLPRFPVPGAANVRVMDLIYGSDRERYRYVFTVEFTVGLVGPRRRVVRVASLSEPRERGRGGGGDGRGGSGGGGGGVTLNLAPAEGSLLDQYRYLTPPGIDGNVSAAVVVGTPSATDSATGSGTGAGGDGGTVTGEAGQDSAETRAGLGEREGTGSPTDAPDTAPDR